MDNLKSPVDLNAYFELWKGKGVPGEHPQTQRKRTTIQHLKNTKERLGIRKIGGDLGCWFSELHLHEARS